LIDTEPLIAYDTNRIFIKNILDQEHFATEHNVKALQHRHRRNIWLYNIMSLRERNINSFLNYVKPTG